MTEPATLTPTTGSDRVLDELVEEFAHQLRAGTPESVEDFARRHPEHAEQLLQVLPAMQILAEFGTSTGAGLSLQGSEENGADRAVGTLGDFRILREIGRGGMGVVYEAEQISLGRRVALKVLPFASTLDARQLQRFKNEAQAAAGLHHTNIVPVFATGCERGVHFYAMQYIAGQTLAGVIADMRRDELQKKAVPPAAPIVAKIVAGAEVLRSPGQPPELPPAGASEYLSPGHATVHATATVKAAISTERSTRLPAFFRTVARLGAQAAEALEHAHQLGIVHRDIKPANLLVDGGGNVWITDFGLAHCQNQTGLTMSGDLLGTLRYMSPEQALAKRVLVDCRTDIYSLGATLYELLTLEPVFTGGDREELLRQIALEEPKLPRRHDQSIPAELETIVLKALEKNSADRYATAQEMADDLERFVKDEPIRARRPTLTRRLKGWSRRHKPLVTGFVVLAVTLLIGGTAALCWQAQQSAAHEQQLAATAEAVRRDLEKADYWQQQEHWPKALQALEKASGRLQGSGLNALQNQVDERLRQAALVGQLNDAQARASELYADGSRDFSPADLAYSKAFAESGLDVATVTVEEIAGQIKTSAIRGRLVAALDHWAYVKERLPNGDAAVLRAIARLADDDGWRKQLRATAAGKDPEGLLRLAADEGALNEPPVCLLLLCYLLDSLPRTQRPGSAAEKAAHDNAAAASLRLLRQAQARYPADFWLSLELGGRLSKQQETLTEAIGYLRVALAVNPRSPVVHNNLGIALETQKKLPEAIAAYHKAIEFKADNACAYCNLGLALQAQGQLSNAVAAFHEAIRIQPKFFLAHNNLGGALLEQQKLAEAEAAYLVGLAARLPWSSFWSSSPSLAFSSLYLSPRCNRCAPARPMSRASTT